MNLYGFAGGDPVNFSDPLGLFGCKDTKTGKELSDAQCVPEVGAIESQMTNRDIAKYSAAIATAGAGGGLLGTIWSRVVNFFIGDEVSTNVTDKISRQAGKRGWTTSSIDETIESPYTTRSATNKANDNPATAFFNKDGSYVVRDNKTGDVIQISNRNDPHWVPDQTIKNPYRP